MLVTAVLTELRRRNELIQHGDGKPPVIQQQRFDSAQHRVLDGSSMAYLHPFGHLFILYDDSVVVICKETDELYCKFIFLPSDFDIFLLDLLAYLIAVV